MFELEFSENADRDIISTLRYIKEVLYAPKAAEEIGKHY